MGTSTVSFRDRTVDVADPVLEVWLKLIVDEVDAMPDRPEWLARVRDDWFLLATEEFGFGAAPDLRGVLTNEERTALFRELAKRALCRLESMGDPITPSTLNAIAAGKSRDGFKKPLAASVFTVPARKLLSLLGASDEDPTADGARSLHHAG